MQRAFSRFLLIGIAFGMCSCASSQLTKINNDVLRNQEMVQTARSETKAENQQLITQINELKSRIDHMAKVQSDLMLAIDEIRANQKTILQNLNKMNRHEDTSAIPGLATLPFSSIGPTAKAQSNAIDPRPEQLYQTAYNDYINRKFDLAIVEFNDFIKSFPDAELADNAQYWIGECYYAQAKFDDALREFEKVVNNHPNGDKIISATLKVGLAYYESGDKKTAQKVLEDLINRFPFSEEARIAEDRLKSLNKTR